MSERVVILGVIGCGAAIISARDPIIAFGVFLVAVGCIEWKRLWLEGRGQR
jgi:hypothetical protein